MNSRRFISSCPSIKGIMMPEILVIDDEDHIRKLYTAFLTREGYNVDSAADGDEAMGLLAKKRYDLIVLDIELEESSGLDLLKRIKAEYPEIMIILNSAYAIYKSDFHTWLADGYVVKSSDIKPLKEKIESLLVTHEGK